VQIEHLLSCEIVLKIDREKKRKFSAIDPYIYLKKQRIFTGFRLTCYLRSEFTQASQVGVGLILKDINRAACITSLESSTLNNPDLRE
jgi:hypothetical protein